ncbi:hypothetical protein MPNT_20156 [Candidatus Methylacidithermus pantelleriae]|uniref:Uncharacterized protein n=1 Tax=Candidatus Methylacidithermus pantelleriae TaxID=2744239 RepID=A0A8J2FSH2_9BACT|nr:hypothetical protein MPNT_20156 [Candidatus Methylacidithermus pantelleriae]
MGRFFPSRRNSFFCDGERIDSDARRLGKPQAQRSNPAFGDPRESQFFATSSKNAFHPTRTRLGWASYDYENLCLRFVGFARFHRVFFTGSRDKPATFRPATPSSRSS